MSADNGYILRKSEGGEFVLQMYFESADEYPDIATGTMRYNTLDEAIEAYEDMAKDPYWICEYGLDVRIEKPTASKLGSEV